MWLCSKHGMKRSHDLLQTMKNEKFVKYYTKKSFSSIQYLTSRHIERSLCKLDPDLAVKNTKISK
jgi:hypothetical protein